jgi:chemotaxis protein histidine kinase CheA
LFRKAHTLKGEASLLKLTTHEKKLHQLENGLEPLRSDAQLEAGDLISIRPLLETLRELSEQIGQALEQLKSLNTSVSARNSTKAAPATATSADESAPTGPVESLTRLIADLSSRLNKPVVFHTTVKDADIPEAHREVLQEVLLHLGRNSMVHGIESTAERTARGKNPSGMIQLELKTHPDFHEIIFQDDGGGLNYDKIRRRAEQLGWAIASDDELRQAIFEPGFSTADKVTELAGRGVGLDAIRHSVQKAGGRILPHSEQGAYCAFQILLPKIPTPTCA